MSVCKPLIILFMMRYFGLLFWVFASTLQAQGLDFLGYPPDAKSMALGGTGVAYRNDLGALSLNPSGILGATKGSYGAISNLIWIGNVKGYSGSVMSKGDKMGAGLYFATLSNGEAQPSSGLGVQLITVGGAYAQQIGNLKLGGGIKYVGEFVNDFRYRGVAADFGVQMPIRKDSGWLGLVIKNVGKMADAQADDLPTQVQGGIAWIPFKMSSRDSDKNLVVLKVMGETSYLFTKETNQLHIHGGIEAKLFDFLLARIGVESKDALRKFSFGVGMEKENVQLDYALIPFNNGSGTGHALSLSFKL